MRLVGLTTARCNDGASLNNAVNLLYAIKHSGYRGSGYRLRLHNPRLQNGFVAIFGRLTGLVHNGNSIEYEERRL